MATPTATPKLPDLARRIAQQEAALAALRRKLDARLTDLNRRREKLRAELRTVESEIEAVSEGETASPDHASPPQNLSKQSQAAAPAKRSARSFPSLAKFLVQLVREGTGKPLPMATLKEQTVLRGFPSKSGDIRRIVEKRASELVQRGLLRRDPGTGGYVLPKGKNGSRLAPPPAAGSKASSGSKPSAAPRPRATAASAARPRPAPTTGTRRGQPSLRSVLFDIMKKEGRTLSAQELAVLAKRAGYKSQSRDFKNVIWVALGNMPEAERDPRGGYRLKKR